VLSTIEPTRNINQSYVIFYGSLTVFDVSLFSLFFFLSFQCCTINRICIHFLEYKMYLYLAWNMPKMLDILHITYIEVVRFFGGGNRSTRLVTCHWQTLSLLIYNAVHFALSGIRTHNISGDRQRFIFLTEMEQYSQRYSVINDCDRRITHLALVICIYLLFY
jgi:hypothetical protein